MVVDSADDANVFSQSEKPRSRDVAYKLTGGSAGIVEIRQMDKHDALVLLRNKLGFVADKVEAVELAHALDSMALALT